MPKISIILTSFNHANFLREAIETALEQTLQDFELIIWDDASSDNSWDIIQSYTDQRIKAYRNERNMRGFWGVNQAIFKHATAPYIAIHHSDDLWGPDKLARQAEFLDTHADIGAVFTKVAVVKEDLMPLEDEAHPYFRVFDVANRDRRQWLRHFFLHSNCLCHPSVLIRKNVYDDIGGYRYGYGQLGDFQTWVRVCLRHQIHVLDEKLVKFRILDGHKNTSSQSPANSARSDFEHYHILRLYRALAESDDLYAVFPEAAKYHGESSISRLFALAMVFIEKNQHSISAQVGLEILLELFGSRENIQTLLTHHNFGTTDFHTLTGKYNMFKASRDSEEIMALIKKHHAILGKAQAGIQAQEKEILRLRQLLRQNQIAF